MASDRKASSVSDIQFGQTDDEPLPPELQEYGLQLYKEVRQAYREAGAPLGPSDEAMLVWFTFSEDLVEHVAISVKK